MKISAFTLDDFENAIRHDNSEQPVALLAEAHACLLAAARERAGTKHIAIDSIEVESEEMEVDNASSHDVSLEDLATEAKGLGYRGQVASSSSSSKDSPRAGWEDSLAIYIRDVSLQL